MRNYVIIFAALSLASCSAIPETVLQNPSTGENVICGGEPNTGNAVANFLSHNIQRMDAQECIEEYQKIGFKKVP